MTRDEEEAEHLRWLAGCCFDRRYISPRVHDLSVKMWEIAKAATEGRLRIPAACTGPDGEMLYCWDRGRHHAEIEIEEGGVIDCFYRDRETEETYLEESDGESLPVGFAEKLILVCEEND
jgi:hypothetical protein